MMLPNFQGYTQRINRVLKNVLPPLAESRFSEALHFCVFNGGKRLRPLLTCLTGEALNITESELNPIATAIELIHCYSLVHDDLPAMDNAALRRGEPTCHKKYDEATAILVGDALLTLAFEVLARCHYLSDKNKMQCIEILSHASGIHGMIKGQVLDLDSNHKTLSSTDLLAMYRHKTGKLLIVAVQLPTVIKKLPETEANKLMQFAESLSTAYQIQDDLLDIESETTTLGKKAGMDKDNFKNTYPMVVGISVAKKTLSTLKEEAHAALRALPFNTQSLQAFTHYVFGRNK